MIMATTTETILKAKDEANIIPVKAVAVPETNKVQALPAKGSSDGFVNYPGTDIKVQALPERPAEVTNDPYGFVNRKKTILEQHCIFFDTDNDGVIWVTDTWKTCRSFGWGLRLSLFFTVFLHFAQSWGSVPWFWLIPDPLARIWIHNIQNNKHGSSTLSFDQQGRLRPVFFDEFFANNDRDGKDGLTFWEGYTGLRKMKNPWDIFGQVSVMFEWGMTYMLLWPEDGIVRKKDAARVLDGTIFHEMTLEWQAKNNVKLGQPVTSSEKEGFLKEEVSA